MPALLLNTAVSLANPRPSFGSRPSSRCQAAASSSSSGSSGGGRGSSWATDYDLYSLLGVEPSSPHSEIKAAYRALQKRCHPDVVNASAGAGAGTEAGPSHHDMAVVLNEVYALLSDPVQRQAYDREQAKRSEFQGYTGRPLYSSWRGGEAETRAVFVDEVACIGCLKCALHAGSTFAIESVHGRARVVAQWADPEDRIADAIQTCPVDCISMVERSDLAALEFLMSKLPRRRVRVSEANAAGSPDIFAEVSKFKARFQEMEQRSTTRQSEESEVARQSRSSAVQTIMSLSNWWYWRPFRAPAGAATAAVPAPLRLLPPPSSPPPASDATDPVTERLKEAAARRKAEGTTASAVHARHRDEYWTPQLNLPSSASFPTPDAQTAAPTKSRPRRPAASGDRRAPARSARIDLTAPLLMGIVAAGIAGYNREEMAGGGVIEDHIGGAAALGVVNSFELQVVLAGVTWFVIGAAVAGFVQVLGRRDEFRK